MSLESLTCFLGTLSGTAASTIGLDTQPLLRDPLARATSEAMDYFSTMLLLPQSALVSLFPCGDVVPSGCPM